jgi:hypothetical protein
MIIIIIIGFLDIVHCLLFQREYAISSSKEKVGLHLCSLLQ